METQVSLSSLSEQSPAWFDVSQAFYEPRLVPPIAGVFLCKALKFTAALAVYGMAASPSHSSSTRCSSSAPSRVCAENSCSVASG